MKKYKLEIVIEEENDEFWEDLKEQRKSGCDDIYNTVVAAMETSFLNFEVKLVEFTDA